MKWKDIFAQISIVLVSSFLLNFVWESYHSVYLYIDHDFSSLHYVNMITYVATMDGLLILSAIGIVSLITKNLFWIRAPEKFHYILFSGVTFIIASLIEYRAIFLHNKWSYNNMMPVVFGIGLSPLFQLMITGGIAVFLTHRLFYAKGVWYGR